MSCQDSKNNLAESNIKQGDPVQEEPSINKKDIDFLDGLYLNEWNHSGFLVIYKGKIHHFNRREFTEVYKDEEYDFDRISSEGIIHIHRKYFLDRKKNVTSEKTLLTDIKTVVSNGAITALIRSGRTFTKIDNLRAFYNQFNRVHTETYKKRCQAELGIDDPTRIEEALNSKNFFIQSGLPYRQLRDGQIEFYELLVNIVKGK